MKNDYEILQIGKNTTHEIINHAWYFTNHEQKGLYSLNVGAFVLRVYAFDSDETVLHVCHKIRVDEMSYTLHYYKISLPKENTQTLLGQLPTTNTLEEVLALGQFYSV